MAQDAHGPPNESSDPAAMALVSAAEEIDVEATRNWTRLFFGMARRPQNGSVTLVFPGLFS